MSYVPVERSARFPGLDLALLVQFLDRPSACGAIRDFQTRSPAGSR